VTRLLENAWDGSQGAVTEGIVVTIPGTVTALLGLL
jgi:hypothetical protein